MKIPTFSMRPGTGTSWLPASPFLLFWRIFKEYAYPLCSICLQGKGSGFLAHPPLIPSPEQHLWNCAWHKHSVGLYHVSAQKINLSFLSSWNESWCTFFWRFSLVWLYLMGFIFALSWDPRGCLSRTTSLGRKQIFTFALYSTLGIVTGIVTF